MSEALYRELMEHRAKQRREWTETAAPSRFIYHSFYTALRLFIDKGAVNVSELDTEFAEELLWLNSCLQQALEREDEPTEELAEMEAALKRHITLLKR